MGASLVRGPYCQLDVGLCNVDVFLRSGRRCRGGLKTGPSRRDRIQPAEGPFLGPRAKETCLKRGQKVDPLEIKSGPPRRVQFWSLFGPFIVANLSLYEPRFVLVPIRFASEAWPRPGLAWPRPGLAEPQSASIAGFEARDLLHQHNRKGQVVMIKTRRFKRLVFGSVFYHLKLI